MANATYLRNRQPYSRPQAMIWSDQGPSFDNDGFAFPPNAEYLSNTAGGQSINDNNFIIISDHNRSPIQVTNKRIDQKVRTANGQLRSYFIADKQVLTASWSMLPSRSFSAKPNFNQGTGITTLDRLSPTASGLPATQYTVDGGAGASEMKMWHDTHPGGFWVYLAYDDYAQPSAVNDYGNLNKYTQFMFMTMTDFSYSVIKRGANNHDMWDVSLTLEEV